MKKLWLLGAALVGSLVLTSPAHAFLIDGFGDSQGPVDAASGTPTDSSGFAGITDTDLTNAQRELTVTQNGGPDGGAGNSVEAEVFGGVYAYSQDTLTFGTGTIDWTFDPESLTSPIAIAINIIEADNANGEVTLTLTGSGGPFSQTLSLPEVSGGEPAQTLLFNISGFPTGDTFESASLFVDGASASALDLTIDFIEVPAPGVLGLLGIGLGGLAFAARRRRSSEVKA